MRHAGAASAPFAVRYSHTVWLVLAIALTGSGLVLAFLGHQPVSYGPLLGLGFSATARATGRPALVTELMTLLSRDRLPTPPSEAKTSVPLHRDA